MNLIDKYAVTVLIDFLKNSELSFTQISEEMNFSSLSYFSRYAQKHLGMSPTEYRVANSTYKNKL